MGDFPMNKNMKSKQSLKYKILNFIIVILILGSILLLGGFSIFSEHHSTSPKISYISVDNSDSRSESSSSSSSSSKSSHPKKESSSSKSSSKENSSSESVEEIIKININSATLEELTKVDGISQHTAELILQYRELAGGFVEVSDLLKIKGLGLDRESIESYFYCE